VTVVGDRVPEHLRELAERVVTSAQADERMLAVVAGGSIATGTSDEYSDLDLVLVCTPESHEDVLAGATEFADRVGPVLTSFTGEHVGERRLLIVLYGPPLAHVDLKFVTPEQLAVRVEDGLVLWQRDQVVDRAHAGSGPRWPEPDPAGRSRTRNGSRIGSGAGCTTSR
jgi:predicted nucleotidyltransferase